MKNRLRTLGVITAVACSLVVTACAGSTTKSGRGGTLTISNENGGLWTCGFNPFNTSTNLLSTGNVYEPLVFVNTLQNQKVTPWLASSYAWSNNNKTVTFTVRDGVKWNDGQPMTASDLIDRQAEEIFLMARVAMARLDLTSTDTDVVLGGGILAARHRLLTSGVEARLKREAPAALPRYVEVPPVVGAALLGLDRLGFGMAAQSRLRDSYLDRDTV